LERNLFTVAELDLSGSPTDGENKKAQDRVTNNLCAYQDDPPAPIRGSRLVGSTR
jgi:hypothetical protein